MKLIKPRTGASVPDDPAIVTGADFLRALFPDNAGYADMRALRQGKLAKVQRYRADDYERIEALADQFSDHDLYVGVAARDTEKNGRASNCRHLWVLFADIDFKDSCEAQARQRLTAFALRPNVAVATGGGLHVYWLLDQPFDLQDGGSLKAKALLRALATALGADMKAAEPARILRLPGTLNHKYTPPRRVTIERFSDRRYSLDELVALLPEIVCDEPAPSGATVESHLSQESRIRRAHEWLAHQPAAIQGQHGDDRTYQVCCAAAVGHDLSEDDTYSVLQDWNAGCIPPWSEHNLRTKIRNAIRYATGRRGEKLVEFPRTEAGDAECFASINAEHVRFDHRRARFLIFSGHRWMPDPDGAVHRLGLDAMRVRQQRALDLTDGRERTAHATWAHKGESRSRIDNMLTLATKIKPISDPGDNWDQDPWLLGAPNGVINLRDGSLRAGRPDDRITMAVRVPYTTNAGCQLWEKTVSEIFGGNKELIAYFQRACGYSITGDCREECLFFNWGDGRNGKGTLMNTLAYVLGDYADDLPFSALESDHRSSIPNDIAKLVGKRYVTASESGESTRLNEARVKALTGRDLITARFMRAEFFTFLPVAKFWLAANHKPIVRDDSQGFWSRIHLLPYTQSFANREDKRLKDKLRDEAPGILAWAVRGCRAWQSEGLIPPALVREATDEYRRESEPLTPFFDECCVIRDGARVQGSVLYRSYVRWSEEYYVKGRLTQTAFGKEVRKQFEVEKKKNVWYMGIGVADSDSEHDQQVIAR
jgi:putative DNA primase/helicase